MSGLACGDGHARHDPRLHEHDHKLAAYCPVCNRWADLERLIAGGRGDYCFIGRKPRCSYCRSPGIWQLGPPALGRELAARHTFRFSDARMRGNVMSGRALRNAGMKVTSPWGMKNESVARRPDYIAFRVAEGGRFVAVIATVRNGNHHTGLPWAFWHSSRAPWGELKRVPADYMHVGIDELTAKRMINLIAAGRSLPDEFIERVPVLLVGGPDFSSANPLV